jgi:DMSO/TMAO reductase YedYZ molybdopterin-dependent catalytic subunit
MRKISLLIGLGVATAGAALMMLQNRKSLRKSKILKPLPPDVFINQGTGMDFETRPLAWEGFITPTDRFYVRSHSPTPKVEVDTWRLVISGTGIDRPVDLAYEQLEAMPQMTITRTLECAGNGRRLFKERFGRKAEGSQWGLGAMGCAEWSGVRLRDVLERAGVKSSARELMPVGHDEGARRPLPIDKAMRDDTLLVLKMNGQRLLPDHGYPLRLLVSGWTAAASIKWLRRIEVSPEPLYAPFNTIEYVLVGPSYPKRPPALGPVITEMPVMSALDLDWPAQLQRSNTRLCGRSFAGESRVAEVMCSINQGDWEPAEFVGPNIEGCWRLWQFDWNPTPGKYEIRVRATDERGRTQPDSVPWNQHGYLFDAVIGHPVTVY